MNSTQTAVTESYQVPASCALTDAELAGLDITDAEREDAKAPQPQVWIMETGETGEGGSVIGIYASRELAREDFYAQVAIMLDRFCESTPDRAERREDGTLDVQVHCDWLTLRPEPVVTGRQFRSPRELRERKYPGTCDVDLLALIWMRQLT
jgi:hypothetical protein